MKRVGGLWPELVSFPNLLLAARRAAAGKRTRPDVAAFLLDLEPQLARLLRKLKDGSYTPGPYRCFSIRDPKPRLISAAPFRDRVVHHALTQVLEPVFEKRFSKDSFACRKDLGMHRALARAKEGARRCRYVLKCDVRKYFPSIDHAILKELLARAVKCRPTLDLAARIIDASNPQEQALAYFPGDDLFTPFERRRGLPLGNQTSQFFANVYLDPLDQAVNRQMRPVVYARYVDDFVLFGHSKASLAESRRRIEEELCRLRLEIHPGKSRVYRTADGFTFLGWRIFPGHTRLGSVLKSREAEFQFRMGYRLAPSPCRRCENPYTSRVRSDIRTSSASARIFAIFIQRLFVGRGYFKNIVPNVLDAGRCIQPHQQQID